MIVWSKLCGRRMLKHAICIILLKLKSYSVFVNAIEVGIQDETM